MWSIARKAVAVGMVLAIAARAWAESPAAGAPGDAAGFQGPGWSYGPWMQNGWGGAPMMGYGGYGGYGGGWVTMIFGAVIVVALLVFLFRALAWNAHPPPQATNPRAGSAGLHALDERYARGEIEREEYLRKKRDILDV